MMKLGGLFLLVLHVPIFSMMHVPRSQALLARSETSELFPKHAAARGFSSFAINKQQDIKLLEDSQLKGESLVRQNEVFTLDAFYRANPTLSGFLEDRYGKKLLLKDVSSAYPQYDPNQSDSALVNLPRELLVKCYPDEESVRDYRKKFYALVSGSIPIMRPDGQVVNICVYGV